MTSMGCCVDGGSFFDIVGGRWSWRRVSIWNLVFDFYCSRTRFPVMLWSAVRRAEAVPAHEERECCKNNNSYHSLRFEHVVLQERGHQLVAETEENGRQSAPRVVGVDVLFVGVGFFVVRFFGLGRRGSGGRGLGLRRRGLEALFGRVVSHNGRELETCSIYCCQRGEIRCIKEQEDETVATSTMNVAECRSGIQHYYLRNQDALWGGHWCTKTPNQDALCGGPTGVQKSRGV